MIPGVGRSRGVARDAIVASQESLHHVFGAKPPDGYPLGTSETAWNRDILERWAVSVSAEQGAELLPDFGEESTRVHPQGVELTSGASGDVMTGQYLLMCEGSDPRVLVEHGLRPDYPPEALIAFARAVAPARLDMADHRWMRTNQGIPVHVSAIPLSEAHACLSVGVRVENLMRANTSAGILLQELARSGVLSVEPCEVPAEAMGPELVGLRARRGNIAWQRGRIVLGIDAAGVIDPRLPQRGEATLRAGRVLGDWLSHDRWDRWSTHADRFVEQLPTNQTGWVDDASAAFVVDTSPERQDMRPLGLKRLAARFVELRKSR